MSKKQQFETRVITPVCRLSYPNIWRPGKPMQAGDEPKFSVELIFEPKDDISVLKTAINNAFLNQFGSSDRVPPGLKNPLRPIVGSKRQGKKGYEGGGYFIGARSRTKPGIVVGPNRVECLDESEVYGGCYVRVSVTASYFDKGVNEGVTFFLNNVWKIRDGDSFASGRNPEADFGEVEMDSEAFGYSDSDEASNVASSLL